MRLAIHSDLGRLEIEAPTGANVADVLTGAGLNLNLGCGGHGTCRQCGVLIRSGSFHLGGEAVTPGNQTIVPSCHLVCGQGDAEIDVPTNALAPQRGRILEDYQLPDHKVAPTVRTINNGGNPPSWTTHWLTTEGWRTSPGQDKKPANPLGIAIDIGTTTVVAVLLDLSSGEVLDRASMYNQQIRRADDIASRISFCRNDADVKEMHRLVVDETINLLVNELCREAGVPTDRVLRVSVSGNTTMMHLLAGLSPVSMGVLPFTPVTTRFSTRSATGLGFHIHPDALADLLPSTSAYIGADIISDLLVSSFAMGKDPALLVDIGTNGEIVLLSGGKLYACATAAGPAFEGAGLSFGCRASRGAIEHIRIADDMDIRIDVIGGGKASGICGSAVVDFLAEGRRVGILNEFGRLDTDRLSACGRLTEVSTDKGRSMACLIAERTTDRRGPISISEADIAQALKAKAAIQAGIRTLLEVCGCREEDLQRLVIAGGFANYVDLSNAASIGLLPSISKDRIQVIGNGSLAGAALCMLDESAGPALHQLADAPHIVELNRVPSFEDHFIESLLLPKL